MKDKHDTILKMYEQKLKYFNYSKRTIEIYSQVSTQVLHKLPLAI